MARVITGSGEGDYYTVPPPKLGDEADREYLRRLRLRWKFKDVPKWYPKVPPDNANDFEAAISSLDEYGAKWVYPVEVLEEAFQRARSRHFKHILNAKILAEWEYPPIQMENRRFQDIPTDELEEYFERRKQVYLAMTASLRATRNEAELLDGIRGGYERGVLAYKEVVALRPKLVRASPTHNVEVIDHWRTQSYFQYDYKSPWIFCQDHHNIDGHPAPSQRLCSNRIPTSEELDSVCDALELSQNTALKDADRLYVRHAVAYTWSLWDEVINS